VALIVVASAFGLSGPVRADTKASVGCRGAIGKNLSKVANEGYKLSNACHKAADKASSASSDCNDVTKPGFDPGSKYAGNKSKATTLIGVKCLAGDPVLDNYDGSSATGATYPDIDSTVGGNSLLVLGNENLNGSKPKIKCLETIAKSRSAIVKEILRNSTKCQAALDKAATTFGPLDASCADDGTKSSMKALAAIPAACSGLSGSDIGACTPLPSCAIDDTQSAAQSLAQKFYQDKTVVTQTCGNGVVEGSEQCDDGNTTDGDGCNHLCESEANTCGPGTVAGGTIVGTRTVHVSLSIPDGPAGPQQLAGVGVGFDYPQLETSIPGSGNSSVVRSAVHLIPMGGITVFNDTDVDFSVSVANSSEFISSGPFLTATLNECVPMSQNVCNRNQNVVGCCPDANIDACLADFSNEDWAHYYDDCKCGAPFSGVKASDCDANYKLRADLGPCTVGACASPPSTITCGHGCTAGGSDKLNHACTTNANCFDTGVCDTGSHLCTAGGSDKISQACSANSDCFDAGLCDIGGTDTCTAGDPSKIGTTCSADTDCDSAAGVCDLGSSLCAAGEPTKIGTACVGNTDCDSAAGVCSAGNICTAGDATRLGLACSIANDCGTPITVATCEACPQLGDRNNGTFGCADIFNGPVCKPGNFPAQSVDGCNGTANGPTGGCPLGNTCELQAEVTTQSCTVTDPVDHNGQNVAGVTCTITVTEP
jgi:cysteine-rich repeat protein